ncbi:hypothetical protein MNBD_ALPHA03-878 [hydrothermal vent metagenome]|uniref:DUF4136 domain-containing protein n=1 Tax=hydrothermal vent metagenome TaxID=652676 RepID=A0A3B1AQC7_9ZZZZ
MTKVVRLFFVLGMVGLMSACSNTFRSDVSRFHELPKPHGETVSIVPADPAKVPSLEFASYANIVGSYLSTQGYVPAGDGKADLIVELDYSVDDGKVMVRSSGSNFSFGYGSYFYNPYWYSPHWGYGFYGNSFFGGYGGYYGSDVRSYVKYTRKLSMVIRPNSDEQKNLFEGTVESKGRSKDLPKLMPHMVQALFTDFPGTSGSTDRVVIELDKN